jgi:predicted Zn finger-like uncharacterized protein
MPIRVNCPSCKTPHNLADDKAGRKVRCRKCEKVISVPAARKARRDDDEAIQERRTVKVKAKAAARRRDDDDDDEDDDEERRPVPRKKAAAGGGSMTLVLVGGIAVVLLMCLGGVGAIGGYFALRKPPEERQAKADEPRPNNNPGPGGNPGKKDFEVPKEKIDPEALKPLPAELPPNLVPRIKQATVYLKVTMPGGQEAEGSGFFAMEQGVVVTNAHVLGMLRPNSPMPAKVLVTVNSGQGNKVQMPGDVIGVDRNSDLAVVRVNQPNLPPPLMLESVHTLIETQKVYIIGFPFGSQLGEEVTVNSAAVSSFRKDPQTGELDRIQVDKGMDPGNSGGPVVNAGGRVVGVSVAGIRGSNINFAVPGEKVRAMLDGQISDTKHGEAFVHAAGPRLPVKYTCLDPFNRIREIRVEVWTGPPGPPRPGSLQKPQSLPGDSQRQTHVVNYQAGVGTCDVPLLRTGANDVCWIQPVIINGKGMAWGPAQATPLNLAPLERVAADLTVNLNAQKERFSSVTSVFTVTSKFGKLKRTASTRTITELYEVLSPENYRGKPVARIKTAYGMLGIEFTIDGKKLKDPDVNRGINIVRTMPPTCLIYDNNSIALFTTVFLAKKNPMRDLVEDLNNLVQNPLEATTVQMPNRIVQPTENFPAKASMMLRDEGKNIFVDLMLTCTYQGKRMRDGREEAVLTVTGNLEGRNEFRGKIDGAITGKITFDMTGRFLSTVNLRITSESDFDTELGRVTKLREQEIDVIRVPGNPKNLALAPEKGPGPGPGPGLVKGKVVYSQNSFLAANDPIDPAAKGVQARMKAFPVKLEAGKTYAISMNSTAFDTFLRLENPKGMQVAEDDDSGGDLNARIIYRSTVSGVFRIICTSFKANSVGPFQLIVQELDGGGGPGPGPGPAAEPGKIVGGGFDPTFRDEAPPGSLLVGFEIGLGKFVNNDIIKAIRPIYRDAKGAESMGKQYGKDWSRPVTIKAKPGYAVGALNINAGLTVDGFSATYMKINGPQLDPNDSYASEYIGGKGGGPSLLTGGGSPIAGIIGKANQNDCTGLGILLKDAGGAKKTAFQQPAKSAAPTNYLKIVSSPGEFIGAGQSYEYPGGKFASVKNARGVQVSADGWSLLIGAPNGQFLMVGEYTDAKRWVFSGASPGLEFSGKGRGANQINGEFVVWELEVDGNQIVRCAIDFVQRSDNRTAPLTGSLRINSNFQ